MSVKLDWFAIVNSFIFTYKMGKIKIFPFKNRLNFQSINFQTSDSRKVKYSHYLRSFNLQIRLFTFEETV